jgi:hypothetical protein
MKALLSLAPLLFLSSANPPQSKTDLALPELHTIKSATLSPSYSCRSQNEFQQGYARTALFLSGYSSGRNSPDLLFNGACGSKDDFEGSTGGDDMSLIADLGTVALEDVTAARAFNLERVHSSEFYSKFADQAEVQADHTYAVLINKRDVRGLFVFSVSDYQPNRKVGLRYAVKEYQVMDVRAESKGFDWEKKNTMTLVK